MTRDDRSTYVDGDSPDQPAPASPVGGGAEERYTLGEIIGRGGMADVRAAVDHTLQREVAVKLLRGAGGGLRARFLAEAHITARLEHPNIVPVHDLGETADGTPYLAMKRVRGRSLAKLQSASPIPLEQVLDIFRKVCDAVAFAHARGVLHRDLKPENVMVGEFGEVVLMDWGIAWSMDLGPLADESATNRRGEIAGTPAFMSPEQAAGAPNGLDVRSDVYSLGAVLYTLLTGEAPYRVMTEEVLESVQRGALVPPQQRQPGLPAELDRVVLRAMALRPEDRYPTALALLEDIDAFVGRRPLVHVRSTWTERAAKWMDRHRGAVRSAGAVAAAALMGLLIGVWRYTNDVGVARDAALASADRARQSEEDAVAGLVAAQVALADTLGAQGRTLEAERHLAQAEALLTGRDLDRRLLDLARSMHVSDNPPPISQCEPHGGAAVLALDLQPDGRRALSWGADGRLVQWDPMDCSVTREFMVGASAGPGLVDAATERAVLTVDGVLAIVDVRSGARSRTPLSLKVRQLGKDGDTLWIRDDEARVWVMEEANGALRPLVAPPVAEAVWRPAASGRLWLADSTRTGGELGGAWDSRTEEALLSSTGVNTLAVTRDGATLLYGSAMGVVAQDLGGDERWSNTQGAVQFVGLAPGDDVAWIVSFDGSVRLADMATGRELATFVGPGTLPTAVAATAHAELLAIGGANGRVATYLRPPERPRSGFAGDLPMLQGLALSSDGLLLATGDYGGVVSLFDVPTGRLIRRWPAHSEGVRQLAFSPDGAKVAAAMRTDGVSVYDLATGEEIRVPLPQRTVSMAWLGDGPRTVDIDGQLWKIDLAGRVAVAIARGLRAASWSLAPLGADRLITAAHHGQDTGLVVLDGRDGKILQRLPLDEEGYHVAGLASPGQGGGRPPIRLGARLRPRVRRARLPGTRGRRADDGGGVLARWSPARLHRLLPAGADLGRRDRRAPARDRGSRRPGPDPGLCPRRVRHLLWRRRRLQGSLAGGALSPRSFGRAAPG